MSFWCEGCEERGEQLERDHEDLLGEIAALAEENTALWCRLAQADQRLAEIIGYCAQEGRDGEPYDTINSIAMGQYSTRGGGK